MALLLHSHQSHHNWIQLAWIRYPPLQFPIFPTWAKNHSWPLSILVAFLSIFFSFLVVRPHHLPGCLFVPFRHFIVSKCLFFTLPFRLAAEVPSRVPSRLFFDDSGLYLPDVLRWRRCCDEEIVQLLFRCSPRLTNHQFRYIRQDNFSLQKLTLSFGESNFTGNLLPKKLTHICGHCSKTHPGGHNISTCSDLSELSTCFLQCGCFWSYDGLCVGMLQWKFLLFDPVQFGIRNLRGLSMPTVLRFGHGWKIWWRPRRFFWHAKARNMSTTSTKFGSTCVQENLSKIKKYRHKTKWKVQLWTNDLGENLLLPIGLD